MLTQLHLPDFVFVFLLQYSKFNIRYSTFYLPSTPTSTGFNNLAVAGAVLTSSAPAS